MKELCGGEQGSYWKNGTRRRCGQKGRNAGKVAEVESHVGLIETPKAQPRIRQAHDATALETIDRSLEPRHAGQLLGPQADMALEHAVQVLAAPTGLLSERPNGRRSRAEQPLCTIRDD